MKNSRLQSIGFPVAAGIVFIALMQIGLIHSIFDIKELQLPLPFDVLSAFYENMRQIIGNTAATVLPAVSGMAAGALIGYGTALMVTAFPVWGYGGLLLMTLINSIPVVALAPLMNRWFETPFISKFVVIAVTASGAMAINSFHGLNDLPENALQLMRSAAATKREVFTRLRCPCSLPGVFTALKIIVPSGMLAAIISEFFSSKTEGLGYMIKYCLKVGNMKQIGWAYILAVSVTSILFYVIVCLLERRFLSWHVSQRNN